MKTTITDFYKFIENCDGIDFNFKNNVLDFLNVYLKNNMAFNAESLERDYIMYCDNYPFSDDYYNSLQTVYDYPADDSNCFFYQYSFINLVRDFTNATDHNPTERKLIKTILEAADDERGSKYNLFFYDWTLNDTPIVKERVDECLLGDDNINFRDFPDILPILKKVKAEIEDMINESLIKTEKDLWDNWLKLIETDLIPQINNPVHLYEFWGYVVDNIFADYYNYEV